MRQNVQRKAITLWSLLLLTRAHFLAGGVVMYTMGVSVALAEGYSTSIHRLLWGQLGVSAIQLMTHLVNEYYDAARDGLIVDRTPFSGGSGILPAGRLGRRIAARGATLAGLVGLIVTLTAGWPVLLVYLLALLIAYSYSAPPLRLMTRGWGEPAAALTIAWLSPLAGYGVATGHWSTEVLWLGLPLFGLSLAFMILVALPDREADASTGKHSWVVRLGRERAGMLHNGLLIASYLLLPVAAEVGNLPSVVVALLWCSLPLAIWQIGVIALHLLRGWSQYTLLVGGGLVMVGLYGLLAILGYRLSAV
jgi:1,4-dihydroxy-2-naphthoate octaprenyltransferase